MNFLTAFLEAFSMTLRSVPQSMREIAHLFRGSAADLKQIFGFLNGEQRAAGWMASLHQLLIGWWADWLARRYAVTSGDKPVSVTPPPEPKVLGVLTVFRWFCRNESREIVDLVLADLKRDIPLMHAEGRSARFIRLVAYRHVYGTVFEISWATVHDLLKKLAKTLGLIGKISK